MEGGAPAHAAQASLAGEGGAPAPAAQASLAERLDAVYGALGSDVRRTLLDRLAAGPLAVADLAAAVAVSWPAVSKHLRVLEEAGLVARAREGRTHRIARQTGPLAEAIGWLAAQAGEAPPMTQAPAAQAADWALAQARALVAALEPASRVVALALGPAAPTLAGGPADYVAYVLRRRLGTEGLRAELEAGLASLRALEAVLATQAPQASELESLTAGASRLTWLLGQHPALADLGLLARRPSAA